jgi:hypothetical protein
MTNQSQAKQIATDLGITEESWAKTLPAHVRCHLAGEDAARSYHEEHGNEPVTDGWITEAYEVDSAGQDWGDDSYGQSYEPAFLAALAKFQANRADDSEDETECAYCGRDVTPGSSVPDLSDDAAWAELAPTHASNCEWIQTRAHRRSTEVEAIECECGTWSGERCQWSGPKSETVVVEWMPEQHRASHEAAGNAGAYPANGSRRLRVERSCAERILEDSGDWARILE